MVMNIPKWLKKHLSQNGIEQIEEAVKKAEVSTSGEIVPMIVERSSTTGHVPLAVFLLLMLFIWIFDLFVRQSHWVGGRWVWLAIDTGMGIILAILLSRFSFIQRILTPNADESLQVMVRAQLEFYQSSIKQTVDSTGVLIFVSLLERRAVVLADKAISDKLSEDSWKHVIQTVTKGIKKGDMAGGFCEGIGMCGELLSKHFPIKPKDIDELPSRLIVKQ